MITTISTMEVRQRIGDLLNRVALRQDEFIIERKGKPLAALVSLEKLEQLRAYARRQALEFMRQQRRVQPSQARADALALEAQRWARRGGRKPARSE